jgi:enamine deaminase RidA (YjgF/YER057c/UK114 family)
MRPDDPMIRTTIAICGIALSAASCGDARSAAPPRLPEARLEVLGIKLPPSPKPVASYVPAVRTGNLVYLAGQGPFAGGKPTITGKVGAGLTEKQGYDAAREAALVALAALRAEVGSLDRVSRIVKVVGFVNSAPGFNRQPWVVNGASEVLIEIFGEAGRHARSSVGVNELPLDIPVEIEIVAEVVPNATGG